MSVIVPKIKTSIHIRSTDENPTTPWEFTLSNVAKGRYELSWYRFSDLQQAWVWPAIDGIQIGVDTVNLCQGAAYLSHVDEATTAAAIQTALVADHAVGSTCTYNSTTNEYDCTIPVAQNILWTNVNATSASLFEKIADEGPTATFSLPSLYVTKRPAKLEWIISDLESLTNPTRISSAIFFTTTDDQIIPGQICDFSNSLATFTCTPYITHSPNDIYPLVGLWDLLFVYTDR